MKKLQPHLFASTPVPDNAPSASEVLLFGKWFTFKKETNERDIPRLYWNLVGGGEYELVKTRTEKEAQGTSQPPHNL